MKKKLLAVAMVCVLTLGLGVAAFGFEPFAERPLGGTCSDTNGGPGIGAPIPPWGPPGILPPWG